MLFEYANVDKFVSDEIFEVKLLFLYVLAKINNEKIVKNNIKIDKNLFAKVVIIDSLF